MYDHTINIIPIDADNFAVKKELLSPKYYKLVPEVKALDNQLEVEGIKYVILPAEKIVDDIDDLVAPHPMDGYEYPLDSGTYGNYGIKFVYPHQINTSRWIVSQTDPRGLHIHNSMGTAKTLSTLWVLDFLFKKGQIKKVLVVAPKVVMRSAWLKEIQNELMHLTTCLKVGVNRDRISRAMIDIINHDGLTSILTKYSTKLGHGKGMRSVYNFAELKEQYDIIVYDECTAIKTDSTVRWKALNNWFNYCNTRFGTKLWLLTGTPVAQSPLDAYALAKIINPKSVPGYFGKWKELTMDKTDYLGYKWEPKANAALLCASVLQPSIRFELADCTDLPEHQFIYVPVDKTVKQAKMFKQMARDFIAEINDKVSIVASNGAAKATKLLQLLSGSIYDEDGNHHETDATYKLEALIEIIDQLPNEQPCVVFCEFIHVQNFLKTKLLPLYKKVEIINGGVNAKERSEICNRVLSCETKVVICHPTTTALGVDFTSTNVVVYFTPTFRNELYLQSIDRVRRLSSVEKGFTSFLVYHIICDPMEKVIFDGLRDKSYTQDQVFKLMREELIEKGVCYE